MGKYCTGSPHIRLLTQLSDKMLVAILAYSGPPWRHPSMHTFGNVGAGGVVHALLAPLATAVIDATAYQGTDVRAQLRQAIGNDTCVDLGCGVGLSTANVGVDSSDEMLRVARWLHPDRTFVRGLAERHGSLKQYDHATIAFLLHEQPQHRRLKILYNAQRIAKTVWVMDINPNYKPSALMLSGEPYLLDYLENIESDIESTLSTKPSLLCEGRVVLWKKMWST